MLKNVSIDLRYTASSEFIPVTFADEVVTLVTGLVPGDEVVETVVDAAGADAEYSVS